MNEIRNKFEKMVSGTQLMGKPFLIDRRMLNHDGEGYEDMVVDLMWISYKEGMIAAASVNLEILGKE